MNEQEELIAVELGKVGLRYSFQVVQSIAKSIARNGHGPELVRLAYAGTGTARAQYDAIVDRVLQRSSAWPYWLKPTR